MAAEQHKQHDDDENQPEKAATTPAVARADICTAATEDENQNDQDQEHVTPQDG
jgi:hypothetical protein